MKKEKITIDGNEIWIIIEECYSLNGDFSGYLSYYNTQPPGLILGEITKNESSKPILFTMIEEASKEAVNYYKNKK
jgi:hypothetical protein